MTARVSTPRRASGGSAREPRLKPLDGVLRAAENAQSSALSLRLSTKDLHTECAQIRGCTVAGRVV